MARMSFKVSGLREAQQDLRRSLREIPDRVKPACQQAMKPMLDAVLAEAPRVSGNLASHISLKVGKPKRGKARVGVEVSGVWYAGLVILGTKKSDGNDFMQRAFTRQGERSADLAVDLILGKELAS